METNEKGEESKPASAPSEVPEQKDTAADQAQASGQGAEDLEGYSSIKKYRWDPFTDVDRNPPDARCLNRIKK